MGGVAVLWYAPWAMSHDLCPKVGLVCYYPRQVTPAEWISAMTSHPQGNTTSCELGYVHK